MKKRAVEVELRSRDLTKQGYDSARANMGKFGQETLLNFEKINVSVGDAATKVLGFGALLGTISAGVMLRWTQQAIDGADAVQKMSQRTGWAAETLSAYSYAAELSGSSIESLEKGLTRFSRVIDEARAGNKAGMEAFGAIGLTDAEQIRAKDSNELLLDIAEAFSKLEDGERKAALAQEFFGKSGTELIPLLNSGRAGIAAMTEEARAFGRVISSETAARAAQFNDNLSRLQSSFKSIGLEIADNALPYLVEFTDQLVEAGRAGGPAGILGAALDQLEGQIGNLWAKLREIAGGGAVDDPLAHLKDIEAEIESLGKKAEQYTGGLFGDPLGWDAEAKKGIENRIAELRAQRRMWLDLLDDQSSAAQFEDLPSGAFPDFEPKLRSSGIGSDGDPKADERSQRERERQEQAQLDFEVMVHQKLQAQADADAKELEQRAEQANKIREAAELEAMTDLERLQAQKDNELALVSGYADARAAVEAKWTRKIADETAKSAQEQIRLEANAKAGRLNIIGQFMGAAANLAQTGGSKLFAISQSLQIGQAIMATHAAAAQARAIPPAPNFALSRIAKALGYINVAAIAATTFGGGSSSGGGGGAGGGEASIPMPEAPAAPAPADFAERSTAPAFGEMNVGIQVNGDALDADTLALKIGQRIAEYGLDRQVPINVKVQR